MIIDSRRIISDARMALLGVKPVADSPYATHLPVLMGLARVRRVRRVLELGSGIHSTSIFLNRSFFPDLDHLASFEDDPVWAETVGSTAGTDSRLDLRLAPAIASAVPPDVDVFDLIFVDDSRTSAERSRTIREVGYRNPLGVVAVHDFEQRCYRRAAQRFSHRFIFGSLTPQVGLVWSRADVNRRDLAWIRQTIDDNASLAPTDLVGWGQVFDSSAPDHQVRD
ncbi:hypothetical protein [Nakamurella sp.]|uniref:hypothetical protein n=1 Tax=Nakamurella sp. TaxID=1869182 RepID=UPI0037831902